MGTSRESMGPRTEDGDAMSLVMSVVWCPQQELNLRHAV